MKGPFERLKYDLRRLWECPVCKRRERAPGSVTFRHCLCRMQELDGQPVVMKLIVDGVERVAPRIVLKHEPLAEEGSGTQRVPGVQGSAEEHAAAEEADPSQPPG